MAERLRPTRNASGAARTSRKPASVPGSAIDQSPAVIMQQKRLQSMFGNAMLPPGRGDVVQRLSALQIRTMFENAKLWMEMALNHGLGEPEPEVVGKIAALTEAWQLSGKNLRHQEWRQTYCEDGIPGLLQGEGVQQEMVTSEEFWEGALTELFRRGEARFRPDTAAVNRRYRELSERDTAAVGERIRVQVTMGQGAKGDLRRFNFFSQDFSSCAPIAFYNQETFIGGLFHYGARDAKQHENLARMRDEISPTWAVMARNKTWDNRQDVKAVKTIVGGNLTEIAGDKNMYTLSLNEDGMPVLASGDVKGEVRLNLTGTDRMPEGIAPETGLGMYHVAETYDPLFEAMPEV